MSVSNSDRLWMRRSEDPGVNPRVKLSSDKISLSISQIGKFVRRLAFCALAMIPGGCDVDISTKDFAKNPAGVVSGKGETSISLVCDTDVSYVYVESNDLLGDTNLKFAVCEALEECKLPSETIFIPYADGACCANSSLLITVNGGTRKNNCKDGCFTVSEGNLHMVEASSCN